MRKTNRRHYDWRKHPINDFRCICSYCGGEWYRSDMVRDRSGNLACPIDQKGLDMVSLAEGNAAGARERVMPTNFLDGSGRDTLGDPDPDNPNPPPVPRPW